VAGEGRQVMDYPDREYRNKYMKLEHTECETNGCQYNVTVGKLAEAEREVERLTAACSHMGILKAQEDHNRMIEKLETEEDRLKAEGQKYKDALDRQTSETMRLSSEHAWCGDFALGQEMKIAKLRKALETHGVHTSVDCTYGEVISSPDRPQKPCVCGLDEALKEIK